MRPVTLSGLLRRLAQSRIDARTLIGTQVREMIGNGDANVALVMWGDAHAGGKLQLSLQLHDKVASFSLWCSVHWSCCLAP